ncbi:IS66 family insertion sequence hypothetical protein, partial [Shigella flexneri]|nr:IS66 family insertion sequence hypothetical protein [Shigella flexneri]EAA5017163.1 IS66 family insertion sequence hypothetical protein [Shigella flexneri]EFX2955318.1 IS66 family insertion sequence hypothetical protein [Shigella flexneri]EFX2997263.1 IS66 family insertion sequence hypothetical protein [Shigella flexneri]EFX4106780.1 IS66 family insertion sequence hypothetical protein [Shigella flexneri]
MLTELLTRAYPCPPLTPRSTVCGLFARFRKSGLSWPLPAGMSEQELDALLYGSASTVPVVLTESTVMPKLPV